MAVIIRKELTVPTANMSSRIRKKTSATDCRDSATALGFVGVALCLFPMCLIVLGDVVSVVISLYPKL